MLFSRFARSSRFLSQTPPFRQSYRAYTMAPGTSSNPHLTPTAPPDRNPSSPHFPHTDQTSLPVPTDLRPIVISGPSGVGKGTLYKLLLERHPSIFATSVSHTTRDPRPGERRGIDYYYITMEEFEKMIEEKAFVEHAKFGGNRYGTSKRTIGELTASGRLVVLDIEMEVCPPFFTSTHFSPGQISNRSTGAEVKCVLGLMS
jgi:hypothetical protein